VADLEIEAKQWFAANLRHYRTLAGKTQSDLGKMVGVTHRYATRLESGNVNVSIGTLARLAGALGVPVAKLLEPRELDPNRRVGRPSKVGDAK